MSTPSVIVTGFSEDLAVAEDCARRLQRAWPGAAAPAFAVTCGSSLEAAGVEPLDAMVVVDDGATDEAAALSLLAMAEEASVPVLALLEGPARPGNCYEFAGALVRDRHEDEATLAAVLAGMMHRQRDVRRLRQEVALAHRFHGGLKGQITKMHEELQLAATVQREFLPRELPELHGTTFDVLWRPSNYVSGDIYDIRRLDEDHVGMFLADAIGHGVPAALMTMVITRSLKTKEIDGSDYRIVPPHEVMGRLNDDMIRRQGGSTRFATAAYAVIDCRRRTMTVAGAGHPPPIVLRADGTTEPLETSGGLLGIFENETYDEVEVGLRPGDQFLIYSDGFEQAFPEATSRSNGRLLPTNRYLQEFELLRQSVSPAAMIQVMRQRLNDQQGSLHQADDVTLLCMRTGDAPDGETPTVDRASLKTCVQA